MKALIANLGFILPENIQLSKNLRGFCKYLLWKRLRLHNYWINVSWFKRSS